MKLIRLYKRINKLRVLDKKPILVYTMGKVGSSSIVKSINKPVIQLHSLLPESPSKYFFCHNRFEMLGFIVNNYMWKKTVEKTLSYMNSSKERIQVIVGIRNPITRNISAYFQGVKGNPDFYSEFNTLDYKSDYFMVTNHGASIFWVEHEFEKNIGVDLYAYPNHKERGYIMISSGKYDIFVYKLECLNKLEQPLTVFLKDNDFKLKYNNVTEIVIEKGHYSEFKKSIKFPKDYLNYILNSKYCKHFYTQEEIDNTFEKYVEVEI